MAEGRIDDLTLTNIANKIRSKLGVSTKYLPSEMPAAIESISGGGGGSGSVVYRQNKYANSGNSSIDSGDITIQEDGQYYVLCGFYTSGVTVTINGVTQALTYSYASDYCFVYEKIIDLNQGDVVRLRTSGSGHCALLAFIIKM